MAWMRRGSRSMGRSCAPGPPPAVCAGVVSADPRPSRPSLAALRPLLPYALKYRGRIAAAFAALFILLVCGVPISLSLLSSGILAIFLVDGLRGSMMLGPLMWAGMYNYSWIAIVLFIACPGSVALIFLAFFIRRQLNYRKAAKQARGRR